MNDRLLSIARMSESDALAVSRWRYGAPYTDYDMDCGPGELLGRSYHAVTGVNGEIVAYCCFGSDAQVPGGHAAGAYDDPTLLDLGLGLRPDLTGRGLGLPVLLAVMSHAGRQFTPVGFRLSVAAWNDRALRCYEKAGFIRETTFRSPSPRGEWEFLLMTRREPGF
jgi:[ribosomal protein S18]-alanine N-acetyltransferase